MSAVRRLSVPAASVPAASVPAASDALEPVAEQTLEQGVLEGRTLFAATGDTGSSCPVLVLGPDAGAGNGVAAASRRGTGFADPDIYKIAEDATDYARDFNDYHAGTNGFYQALPGWDYVSGWGTPVLSPLMSDLDGRTAPVR